MSDSKSKSKSASRKPVPFATVRQRYAKQRDLDVSVASKRLRAKIRNAYGKDDTITKWLDRHNKDNKDGNRYGDVTPAEAKAILSL